jgi:hypothetical protein
MAVKISKAAIKLGLFALIILSLNFNAFSRIIANRGDESYDDSGLKTSSINSLIIEGAGNYLTAYSDYLLFLNRVELSSENSPGYDEMQTLLNRCLEELQRAKTAYLTLDQNAMSTPYNPEMIYRLIFFNYDLFQWERGLNPYIFKDVKKYLSTGNVNGIFDRLLSVTGTLVLKVTAVKDMVDAYKFPDLNSNWRLNQLFSETLLFGQYAAEVFQAVGN